MENEILFIDTASIMNAIGALTYREEYQDWTDWEYQSINQVTGSFLFNRFLKIAPGPLLSYNPSVSSTHGSLYKYYDFIAKELGPNFADTHIQSRVQIPAMRDFKIWLNSDIETVKKNIAHTKHEKSYPYWIDWAVEEAFPDHAARLNGLFDLQLIKELSKILETKPKELKNLWEKTKKDQELVKRWSNGRNQNEDFELAKDAYVAATILRGRLHDEVSRKSDLYITHHPIRENVLPPLTEGTTIKLSKTIVILSNIIIKSAMEEKDHKERVILWIENIKRTQDAFFKKDIPELKSKTEDDGEALSMAKSVAKKLELRLHTHWFEGSLDTLIAVGVATATTIVPAIILFRWNPDLLFDGSIANIGVAGGVAGGLAPLAREKFLGRRIAQKINLREGRLNELAKTPGRIVYPRKNIKKILHRLP